jgi:hypothetical protein
MKNKFVIGIGSQRAGSTLLHKILQECTPIFMHPVKELHYYDTLYHVRHESVLKEFSSRQISQIIKKLVSSNNYSYIDKEYRCFARTNLMLEKQDLKEINYVDLYRPCILDNEYLGEITPEYMILPDAAIKRMQQDIGGDAKIILIARDPVERFLSSFKLLKMYHNNSYDNKNFEKDLQDTISSMPDWMKQQDDLNNYKEALDNYRKYFDSVLLIKYDEFTQSPDVVLESLVKFLGIDFNRNLYKEIASKKVNSIGETGEVSLEMKKYLAERYESSIEFLREVK